MTKYAILPLLALLVIPISAYAETFTIEPIHTTGADCIGLSVNAQNVTSSARFFVSLQGPAEANNGNSNYVSINVDGKLRSEGSYLAPNAFCSSSIPTGSYQWVLIDKNIADSPIDANTFATSEIIQVIQTFTQNPEPIIEEPETETVEELNPSITTESTNLNNGMNAVTITGTNLLNNQNMDVQIEHGENLLDTYNIMTTADGTFSLIVEIPVELVGQFNVNVLTGQATVSSSFEQAETTSTETTTPTTVTPSETTTTTPNPEPTSTPNTSNEWDQFILDLDAEDRLALIKAVMKYFLS